MKSRILRMLQTAQWLDSLKTRLWELNKDNERVEVSHMNKLEVVLREINGQIIRNRGDNGQTVPQLILLKGFTGVQSKWYDGRSDPYE